MVSTKPEGALCRGQSLLEAAARCGELSAWITESLDRQGMAPDLSNDLRGEVTLLIWMRRGQFRGEDAFTLRAWVSQVAQRTSRALIRSEKAHRRRFLTVPPSELELHQAPAVSAEESTERCEREARLISAVDRLVEPLRAVVILNYLRGMPVALVAETLGKSRSRFYEIRERALLELRVALPDGLDPRAVDCAQEGDW